MLTDEQRGSIITAKALGHSNRAVAKVVGCHHKTVLVLSRHIHPEDVPERKPIVVPRSSTHPNVSRRLQPQMTDDTLLLKHCVWNRKKSTVDEC